MTARRWLGPASGSLNCAAGEPGAHAIGSGGGACRSVRDPLRVRQALVRGKGRGAVDGRDLVSIEGGGDTRELGPLDGGGDRLFEPFGVNTQRAKTGHSGALAEIFGELFDRA